MRTLVSGGLIAAALGTAMAVTGAMSASAQVARPQQALATDSQSGLLTLVKNEHPSGGSGGVRIGGGPPSGGMPMIKNSGPITHSGPGPITHSGPSAMNSTVMPQHMTGHDNDRDRNRHHRRFVDRDFFFFNSFAFAPDYYPDYYYDNYGYDDAVAYCLNRFRTYDLATHTYIGLDGLRHPCP